MKNKHNVQRLVAGIVAGVGIILAAIGAFTNVGLTLTFIGAPFILAGLIWFAIATANSRKYCDKCGKSMNGCAYEYMERNRKINDQGNVEVNVHFIATCPIAARRSSSTRSSPLPTIPTTSSSRSIASSKTSSDTSLPSMKNKHQVQRLVGGIVSTAGLILHFVALGIPSGVPLYLIGLLLFVIGIVWYKIATKNACRYCDSCGESLDGCDYGYEEKRRKEKANKDKIEIDFIARCPHCRKIKHIIKKFVVSEDSSNLDYQVDRFCEKTFGDDSLADDDYGGWDDED